jgi:hypothetical protein
VCQDEGVDLENRASARVTTRRLESVVAIGGDDDSDDDVDGGASQPLVLKCQRPGFHVQPPVSSQVVCDRFRERCHATCQDKGVDMENRPRPRRVVAVKVALPCRPPVMLASVTTMVALPSRSSCKGRSQVVRILLARPNRWYATAKPPKRWLLPVTTRRGIRRTRPLPCVTRGCETAIAIRGC